MRRAGRSALVLGWAALAPVVAAQPPGAPNAGAPPAGVPALEAPLTTWAYAHDLRARAAGVTDFGPTSPKIGVEVWRDPILQAMIAVSQSGSLAVAPFVDKISDKKAEWLYGEDLVARAAAEEEVTAKTARFGVEAFRDGPTGRVLYVTDKATIAYGPTGAKPSSSFKPELSHALQLWVRAPDEEKVTSATKRFGIEVQKDPASGALIYLSETGALASGPAPAKPLAEGAAPKPSVPLHALVPAVRKAGEKEFGPAPKRYGVEVFRDDNSNSLVYLSSTGSVAVAPVPSEVKKGQGVTWKRAVVVDARPGGEKDFKKGASYGVEVYQDNNTGHTLFISDTGAIAVMPGK